MSKKDFDVKKFVHEIVSDKESMEELTKKSEKYHNKNLSNYTKLSENQIFDIMQIFAEGILTNVKRADCIAMAEVYLQQFGIEVGKNVSEKNLIAHYTKTRDQIQTRNIETIEQARERYVRDMQRLTRKAEQVGDISNAMKGVEKLAEFEGALKKQDESKVILNLIPVEDKTEK